MAQSQEQSICNMSSAPRDARLVWSEDNPAAVWTAPTPENFPSNNDLKVALPTYNCNASHFKGPPPRYHACDIPQEQIPAQRNSILDRPSVKFLAMVLYLLVFYKVATASLQPDSSALNWTWPEDLSRAHSRDFISFFGSDYAEFPEQDDGWSRSRLGKLGSYSPLLTSSEMNLFVEAEWVVEPNENSYEINETGEDYSPSNKETIFTGTSTTGGPPHLPLPLHMPSSLFKLSQDMFDQAQGTRHHSLPFDSDPHFLRLYETQP